jgi:polysaccharide biosynthesis/export protein
LNAFRPICFALVFAVGLSSLHAEDSAVAPAAGGPTEPAEYLLQPFDLVEVVVFQEPDLQRQVRLSQESTVTLPLIGAIDLKGKTVRQAQDMIRDLYNRDYLVNPQINVIVLEYARETVNVMGSVNTPGAISLPPLEEPLKLLDAITRAGGFSRLADRKHVKLTRTGADGKTTTAVINADDIIQSTSTDPWLLQKGDVIYVPERIL